MLKLELSGHLLTDGEAEAEAVTAQTGLEQVLLSTTRRSDHLNTE